jgi:hypothetical protein
MKKNTEYKECKICKGLTIITIVQYLMLKKEVITTNCKCGKNKIK